MFLHENTISMHPSDPWCIACSGIVRRERLRHVSEWETVQTQIPVHPFDLCIVTGIIPLKTFDAGYTRYMRMESTDQSTHTTFSLKVSGSGVPFDAWDSLVFFFCQRHPSFDEMAVFFLANIHWIDNTGHKQTYVFRVDSPLLL